jgi:DNA invertase Pin-like site-specific DNA recombinase
MNSSELIKAEHLTRQAIVYIRQSTPQQAISNRESLDMQYALRNRARQSGWPDERIVVIDADLGMTGSTTEGRAGFKDLVGRVSLGQVGIIFAFDVTRLARNCSDWYQMLDLCGFRGCLIGDHDAIYDPASINGRLLLGLKGQISELELYTIRARLNAGMLNKAKRGELIVDLPIGFVKTPDNRVAKHPDEEVRSRVKLVFTQFLRQRSLGKVVRYFNDHRLLFPRRIRGGEGVRWRAATTSAVSSMLRNPTYSGAYAYGKTRFVPQNSAPHKKRKQRIDRDQWKVLLTDHHPGYVSWEEFVKIQQLLEANHAEYARKRSPGAARSGAALLQGIVYCGQCGHQMTIQYRQHPKYTCNYLHQQRRTGVCAIVRADVIDAAVVPAFWNILSAEELDLFLQAQCLIDQEIAGLERARAQELQRLRYQAELAERQYQHCDPANRLVAGELERRWELALQALREAEEKQQREPSPSPERQLTADQRQAWQAAGSRLPDMWHDGRLTAVQKKRLLRALIDKVVVQIPTPGQVDARIVWKGGSTMTEHILVPVGDLENLARGKELKARILEMAKQGLADEWIAYQLSREGFRQSHLPYVSIGAVQRLRHQARLLRPAHHASAVPDGHLSLTQVVTRTGVTLSVLFDLIIHDRVHVEIVGKNKSFAISSDKKNLKQVAELATTAMRAPSQRRAST